VSAALPPSHTIWIEPQRDESAEALLTRELGVHPLTARLLVNRDIRDPDAAYPYLNPNLGNLHDPLLLPDMDKASHRLADAIKNHERIFVHGDYDADGVTSTALYVRAIEALGGDVIYRVPHRKKHGYDIKDDAVQYAYEKQARLILTTDCGIQAVKTVDFANQMGIPVIITDHHEPGPNLPKAHAVVNPHRHDSTYPFSSLAGVGVAFKTMQAVVRLMRPELERRFLDRYLELAALGTIADVMPLTGENRVIARFGLDTMRQTKLLGLSTLVHGINLDPNKPITPQTVSFQVAPKINAIGRLDAAELALELLLTRERPRAEELVAKLVETTEERRTVEAQILAEAEEQVKGMDLSTRKVIVLAAPGWHTGVVGIVAQRIRERHWRPAIVLCLDEATGTGKGSARSIDGFDLHAGLVACGEHLDTFGGHKAAAGLSLATANLPAFDAALNAYAATVLTDDDLVPREKHDGWIDPSEITPEAMEEWSWLAPYGMENPRPRFASRKLCVRGVGRMGAEQQHLQLRVGTGQGIRRCVGWRLASLADNLAVGQSVDLLYDAKLNHFNGTTSVELEIKACLACGDDGVDTVVPDDVLDEQADVDVA